MTEHIDWESTARDNVADIQRLTAERNAAIAAIERWSQTWDTENTARIHVEVERLALRWQVARLFNAATTAELLLALADDGLRDVPSAWTQRMTHDQIRHVRALLNYVLDGRDDLIAARHAAEQAVIAAARRWCADALPACDNPPCDVAVCALKRSVAALDRLATTPTPAAETEAPTP